MEKPILQSSAAAKTGERASATSFAIVIYLAAFIIGAIVMSFEMLGSRYLNPYFGSSIYTWAALISTVLAALTAGYFLGGRIADHTVSAAVLGAIVTIASLYLLVLPSFADNLLKFVSDNIDNVRLGGLYSALAIMFVPATLLGVYSPFAIRLVLRTAQSSGTVSGASLWRFHRGLDRRHARHDILLDPADRNARYHIVAGGGRHLLWSVSHGPRTHLRTAENRNARHCNPYGAGARLRRCAV